MIESEKQYWIFDYASEYCVFTSAFNGTTAFLSKESVKEILDFFLEGKQNKYLKTSEISEQERTLFLYNVMFSITQEVYNDFLTLLNKIKEDTTKGEENENNG